MAKARKSKRTASTDPDHEKWASIKVTPRARTLVEQLMLDVATNGWRSLGAPQRTDGASRGALIEEGLAQLGTTGKLLADARAARDEAIQLARHFAEVAGHPDDAVAVAGLKRLDALATLGDQPDQIEASSAA